jgi:hypothetical protein
MCLLQQQIQNKEKKNFIAKEDHQFCKSYFHVSQALVIDNGQKSIVFWERVQQHYNNN